MLNGDSVIRIQLSRFGLLDSLHFRMRRTAMFLLPIGTDAPVDHFPWATISLIVAKSLVFLAATIGWLSVGPLVLAYGEGLHPLQWLTSLFVHDGLLHLAGNLLFLWGFGLIVEGKLGWRRFLAAYLSVGIVESALEQICLHQLHGSSMGASAAIAGLMAMAVVWAPRNEIIFGYGIFFSTLTQVGSFGITIGAFSAMWAALEVLSVWWLDIHASAAVLHLLGGLLGLGMGVALLQQGRVDCEGWDLFALWERRRCRSIEADHNLCGAIVHSVPIERRVRGFRPPWWGRRRTRSIETPAVPANGLRRRRAEDRVRELLSDGKPGAALREWNHLRHFLPEAQLNQDVLRDLFQGLFDVGMWQDSVTLMEEYMARFADDADQVRLQAASVLIHRLRRPRAALRTLEVASQQSLTESLGDRYHELSARAQELIDTGVIELSSQSFQATSN